VTNALLLALAAALGMAGAVASCSAVPADSRIGVVAPVDGAPFTPVADYLGVRCGSLDCHGQPGRNMRVWNCLGMRLNPNDISFCGGPTVPREPFTTPDEYEATYRSIVGLEPTVMSTVVAGHGEHPELLTMVRKARGLEAHKGGVLITPGDAQDVCITSWLAGNVNNMECISALTAALMPTVMPMATSPLDASTE
jgi:hypothetical protein